MSFHKYLFIKGHNLLKRHLLDEDKQFLIANNYLMCCQYSDCNTCQQSNGYTCHLYIDLHGNDVSCKNYTSYGIY